MDGMIVTGPIKSCLLDATIILLAVYYTFNVQYPTPCNLYPFFEFCLFGNNNAIKNKVVINKILSFSACICIFIYTNLKC